MRRATFSLGATTPCMGLHLNSLIPLTLPSFNPSGLYSSTPHHRPVSNGRVPKYLRTPGLVPPTITSHPKCVPSTRNPIGSEEDVVVVGLELLEAGEGSCELEVAGQCAVSPFRSVGLDALVWVRGIPDLPLEPVNAKGMPLRRTGIRLSPGASS